MKSSKGHWGDREGDNSFEWASRLSFWILTVGIKVKWRENERFVFFHFFWFVYILMTYIFLTICLMYFFEITFTYYVFTQVLIRSLVSYRNRFHQKHQKLWAPARTVPPDSIQGKAFWQWIVWLGLKTPSFFFRWLLPPKENNILNPKSGWGFVDVLLGQKALRGESFLFEGGWS